MPTFRGKPCCDCQAQWLPAYEAELLARGVIQESLDIFQLIGGAPKSGGTHLEGGAGDFGQTSDTAIWVARQMGADATWRRPRNWDGKDGVEHSHSVLRGCPHNGPARYQVGAVDLGYNGLGKGGFGGPDTGPRPLSKRTWQQGLEWQRQQAEKRARRAALTATIVALRAKRAAIKDRIGRLVTRRKAL